MSNRGANKVQLLLGTTSPCILAVSCALAQGEHLARLGWAGAEAVGPGPSLSSEQPYRPDLSLRALSLICPL